MYTDTVTIFNKRGDSKVGITWYPTVLHNVDLITDKGANVAKTGLESADTAKLHIRYTLNNGAIKIAEKTYKRPKEWVALSDLEIPTALTFNSGSDFFARGEFSETPINESDQAYKGGFQSYFNKTHDDVYLITTAGGPYTVIPHFEIGGK